MSDSNLGAGMAALAGPAVAPRVAATIGALGGGFMISRQAKAAAEANGLADPWAAYFTGRCGVLGDVDAGVVVASLVFFNPDTVSAGWAERRAAGIAPDVGSERFRQACFAWGRARLDGFGDAARLADLLEGLAAEADPVCAPIFAGWRALDRPEVGDDLARVAFAAHLLREHRMAVHAVAVRALRMRPLDAVLAGPGGEGNAAFFGWQPPYPDVSALAEARTAVEDLTDVLAEPVFASLVDAEVDELVDLLTAATETAHPRALTPK